jgi:hypothetical protein
MHTQRIYGHHESESQFLCINSELLYMESSTQLSTSLLCSLLHAFSTIHNEGVYIHFPSTPKTVKSKNLKLPTNINAFLVLQTRAGHSRSDYNLLVRLSLTITFKFGASNLQKFKQFIMFSKCVALVPRSLDVDNAPASFPFFSYRVTFKNLMCGKQILLF